MPRLNHERGSNMARLIAVILGLTILLVLVACGDSDEEKLFKSIYYSNIDVRTAEVLRDNGQSPATDAEYDVACELWDKLGYVPTARYTSDAEWDKLARVSFEWKDDVGASMGEVERIQAVWLALDATTNVLHRELDTIYVGKDFCEFKHR